MQLIVTKVPKTESQNIRKHRSSPMFHNFNDFFLSKREKVVSRKLQGDSDDTITFKAQF